MQGIISYSDFEKVEMRVGRIIEVEDFPKAKKPAYKLTIDFGSEIGVKKSSAQITKLYKKEELPGKLVIAVVNFPPKKIADFISEVLVLGVNDEEGNVVLLTTERNVKLGEKVY
ncbi:tRNA-binding protein YgjH [Thermovenabulum gondwanense]|uniref:tRNA-binding protein YgjH n=1 Tax=Thermovenabulum gondwanense TaxID=520767 RepID=A0A162MVA3_9FIRM|nr:tRNA-binding protein [Thermovenabulum gondwanense]KYO67806.1 tRNA-binding protein YgjH [Thermovenabulum gondwanense]